MECKNILDCFRNLKYKAYQLPAGHEKEVVEYDIYNAENVIMDWQKHIVRGVQQTKARTDAFANLDQTSAIWIRDYAQKFLPTKVIPLPSIL